MPNVVGGWVPGAQSILVSSISKPEIEEQTGLRHFVLDPDHDLQNYKRHKYIQQRTPSLSAGACLDSHDHPTALVSANAFFLFVHDHLASCFGSLAT
jgi:hypothetical protein